MTIFIGLLLFDKSGRVWRMISLLKLDGKIEKLSRLAGVSPEVCIERAVTEYLDDLSAVIAAQKRGRKRGRIYSSTEAKSALGF
jgi:hypothetical protein